MNKFITESVAPLLPEDMDEFAKNDKLALVESDLKIFIKGEMSAVNKEMAKKSRELFILAADIETLKENIESLQSNLQKSKQ